MSATLRPAFWILFLSLGLFCAADARAGMIDVSANALLKADVVADLAGGNAGAVDHQESHRTGGVSTPSINADAQAVVPTGDLSVRGSFGQAMVKFVSTATLLTVSSNVDATFDPDGHALTGTASAVSVLDLPLTIKPGFLGRFDLSVSVFHITPDGGEVNVEFDQLGTETLPVLHMTFRKDFAKHFIDRLKPGDYRLKVTASAKADSDNAVDLTGDAASAGYSMSISPSTVPVVVPLPTAVWPGLLVLIGLVFAASRRSASIS